MFDFTLETPSNGRVHKYSLDYKTRALSYADVLNLWQRDEAFRSFFISLLSDSPFSAFRWETPPITHAAAKRNFEFVLLDCPGLARAPDAKTYANHFTTADLDDKIAVFENLGRDAVLVVPCPCASESAYPHLAAFVRTGPDWQKHALWRAVGKAVQDRISDQPLWLNTVGGGVSWLHVRLDSRPKYYGFQPYTKSA